MKGFDDAGETRVRVAYISGEDRGREFVVGARDINYEGMTMGEVRDDA